VPWLLCVFSLFIRIKHARHNTRSNNYQFVFKEEENQSIMGNFNDKEPDETYRNTSDMLLYDVINGKTRYAVPGDMIQFHRKHYEHWGIYIGHDKVIQVTVQNSDDRFIDLLTSVSRVIVTLGQQTAFAEITEEYFHKMLTGDAKARINNFKDK
jgi:cell wall-associated NlpC family hydrolase